MQLVQFLQDIPLNPKTLGRLAFVTWAAFLIGFVLPGVISQCSDVATHDQVKEWVNNHTHSSQQHSDHTMMEEMLKSVKNQSVPVLWFDASSGAIRRSTAVG